MVKPIIHFYIQFIIIITSQFVFAQVGIGTTTPDNSSVLDISSSNKGVLVPRVALISVNNLELPIDSPATGLLVWNTNQTVTGGIGEGFYFFNGDVWRPITQSIEEDHDFYSMDTNQPPEDISDDIYTLGRLSIGSPIVNYPLSISHNSFVSGNTNDRILNIDVSNTGNSGGGAGIGLYVDIGSIGDAFLEHIGGKFSLSALGRQNAETLGLEVDIVQAQGSTFGLRSRIMGQSTLTTGILNELTNEITGEIIGIQNNTNGLLCNSIGLLNELFTEQNSVGVKNYFQGTNNTGVENIFSGGFEPENYGLKNKFSNLDGNSYGMYNNFILDFVPSVPNYSVKYYGQFNRFPNKFGHFNYGIVNLFEPDVSSPSDAFIEVGLFNGFGMNSFTSSASKIGLKNAIGVEVEIPTATENTLIGVENVIESNSTTQKSYGVKNFIIGSSSDSYGTYNYVGGANSNYGVYSELASNGPNDYAGYFIGKVAIGNSISTNYILPQARGEEGQVITTDVLGNTFWSDPAEIESFWVRDNEQLSLSNPDDDIFFESDQTTIIFPNASEEAEPMIHMFAEGTSNSNRMVISHSPELSNNGIEFSDVDEAFRFVKEGEPLLNINLDGGTRLSLLGDIEINGDIITDTDTYPDYVFEHYFNGNSKLNPLYNRLSLLELESYLKAHQHLPNVKSLKEVKANDMKISVGEMATTNLEKIEEAYLYIIELKKENDKLKSQLEEQQKQINYITELLQNRN